MFAKDLSAGFVADFRWNIPLIRNPKAERLAAQAPALRERYDKLTIQN